MKNLDFEVLGHLLQHRKRVQKYYWAAAILFWLGVFGTIQYYIAQTGTEPSWIPGVLMLSGAGLYFVVRHLNK